MASKPKTIFLKDYQPFPFVVESLRLHFDLHPTATRVKSEMRVAPNPKAKKRGGALELDGEKLSLKSIAIDGMPLATSAYRITDETLRIAKVPKGKFTLTIENEINPQANTELSGLYLSNGVFTTQCEAEGFRRITYFPDRPDVLTRYQVRIEADAAQKILLSNGNPVKAGKLVDGRHFAEWDDPHPKPSYLFALVAGNLAGVHSRFTTMNGRRVKLGIYVEPGKEDRCAWAMKALKTSMRWDETAFKREYDLDVFNIVAVSDFNMGAMENKGLNIFNDKYILAKPDTATDTDFELIERIIAHEYFHNWTGNRITCRDWFQLCLKEGLTVFRDQEFTSDLRSRAVKRIDDVQKLRQLQFPEDFSPLQHPPRPSSYQEINNFYTTTVYEKGAELCRMIKTLIGAKAFARGMQLYFKRHDGEAATVEQFVKCFEDASRKSLKQFMLWYTQGGTPQVYVIEKYNAKSKVYSLQLKQYVRRLKGQKTKLPLLIPLQVALLDGAGKEIAGSTKLVAFSKARQEFKFKGMQEKPLLSINRGFSSPIQIEFKRSTADLLRLVAEDHDSFSRWEAVQELSQEAIIGLYDKRSNGGEIASLGRALTALILSPKLDAAYRAKLLQWPALETLAARIGKDVDAQALFDAKNRFLQIVAQKADGGLKKVVAKGLPSAPYSANHTQAGARALFWSALSLASRGGLPWAREALVIQAAKPRNMTNEFSALSLAAQEGGPTGEKLLAAFYERHSLDPLLVDKWFAVQAGAPQEAASRVRSLMNHPAFALKTPNRVYALLRNFIGQNFAGFHDAGGEGYRLAADAILAVDKVNPQVAARLANGFRSWRLFDAGRRARAQAELKRILAAHPLSRDVFEIVSKTLQG